MSEKRREYEMSAEDLARILDACKPVPYMVFGGRPPRSPQENANAAWRELGERLGFVWHTAGPSPKGPRWFMAEPINAANENVESEVKA